MAKRRERRALSEGLEAAGGVDAEREASFVFGNQARPQARESSAKPGLGSTGKNHKRSSAKPEEKAKPAPLARTFLVPVTTRLRSPLVADLKRASLERQLAGVEP